MIFFQLEMTSPSSVGALKAILHLLPLVLSSRQQWTRAMLQPGESGVYPLLASLQPRLLGGLFPHTFLAPPALLRAPMQAVNQLVTSVCRPAYLIHL